MNLKDLDQGQDSFLDIIANLVGVLIILVVLVGAQATSSLVAPPEEESTVELQKQEVDEAAEDLVFEELKSKLQSELSAQELVENKLRLDRTRLELEANDEKMLAQQLATRRHAMLTQLEFVRNAHEGRKKEIADQLDQKQQEQLRT